ncbi:MAG: LacI family transcriptional regulator [Acidimicrobiia bacterium]|nr:LacI family transcriptional regulator [Acidimicrobiia bacterium]
MRHPTIEDVARTAGVSVATVSRALRDLPNVAVSTRDRVLTAARELDYEIDPQASRLASGRTMTIGLIAPLFGTWYVDRVVNGAESVLADAGYDLLITSTRTRESLSSFFDRIRSFGRRIDGALVIDLYVHGADLARLETLGVPAVTVGEDLGPYPSITIDNRRAGAEATRHLIDLGHRRIGLIGGSADSSFSSPVPERREQGWRDALETAGLPADPGLVVEGEFVVDGGERGLARLLSADDPPTAIFCMSDYMALGALIEARRRGIEVPRDLSIVGFDDHELSRPFGITTMRQDVDTIGTTAATVLNTLLCGDTPAVTQTVHDVTLVKRESTGPAPVR